MAGARIQQAFSEIWNTRASTRAWYRDALFNRYLLDEFIL
jgi:hypothetical protein